MKSSESTRNRGAQNRYRFGFAAVAFAFLAVLAFSTVPTPLWSLYAQRDDFSSLTITLLFAAYAVGVAASLFLVGHVSDWRGRRRVLVPALVVNIIAGVVFLLWPQTDGLLAARIINGLGVGAVNATATAWLVELHTRYRGDGAARRAQAVAAAVNLAGLGSGALISGLLAQWAGDPLTLPFLVFIAAMSIALLLLLAAPETRAATRPRPRYRPQRVSVPTEARSRFLRGGCGRGHHLRSVRAAHLAGAERPRRDTAPPLARAGGRGVIRCLRDRRAGPAAQRLTRPAGAPGSSDSNDARRAWPADGRGVAAAAEPGSVHRRRIGQRRRQRADVQRSHRHGGVDHGAR